MDTGTYCDFIQYSCNHPPFCSVKEKWLIRTAQLQNLKGIDLPHRTASSITRHLAILFTSLICTLQQPFALAEESAPFTSERTLGGTISNDYGNFYSKDRLIRLGIAFGLGGIAANTNIDMNLRNWYQEKVRNDQTNAWSSEENNNAAFRAKLFGEGKYMIPAALLAASVNLINEDTAVGNWGASASRAYIVGLPAAWGMQFVTGAARPTHNAPSGSAWRPFNEDKYYHGVSGHAFVGAVPFITIAYMNQDNPWVKYPAYIASTAAAISRVNDDAHFPSQIFLGWYMAWEAVDSVMDTNKKKNSVKVTPMVNLDGYGVMVGSTW